MNIVTGYRGEPHITANAMQAFNQGIFGSGNCVLDVGNRFAATLTNATTVTVQDGEGVMQGVHFRIAPGDTETVSISPGTSGYKRIDLICARYTKSAITGVESVDLVVVEGTPDASTASEPSVNSGTILTGGSPVDFPLWKVSLDGLTPTLSSVPMYSSPAYSMPYDWSHPANSSNVVNESYLTVIPAQKIMKLFVRMKNEDSNDLSMFFAGKLFKGLPLVVNSVWQTIQTTDFFPLFSQSDVSNVNPVLVGQLHNYDSTGNLTGDLSESMVSFRGTFPSGSTVSGSIVLPYFRLCDRHPLSSGTLITPEESN